MNSHKSFTSSLLVSVKIRIFLLLIVLICVDVSHAQPNVQSTSTTKSLPKELLSVGDEDDVMRFGTLEKNPIFVGGPNAWYEWLDKTIVYPHEALKKGIGGTVMLTFIVERDGSITDIWVRESVDPLLDKEAVRIAKKMPKWSPGIFNGEPVRVRYNLPLTFEIIGKPTKILKPVLVAPKDQIDDNLRVQKQQTKVSGFDNNSFYVSFFSESDVYSGHGNKILVGNDSVISVKNNPAGNSIFSLHRTGKGHQYALISRYYNNNVKKKTINYKKINLTTACYRPDARLLAIARSDKQIEILNAINDTLIQTLQSSIVPQHMAFSSDGYYLVTAEGRNVEIWNMERGTVRKSFVTNAVVNDIAFANNRKLLLVTADGKLTVFDTSDFMPSIQFEGLDLAMRCRAIGDGKYVAVLTNDRTIAIANLLDRSDVTFKTIGHGNTTDIGTATGMNDDSWLIYNSNIELVYSAIGYSRITGLKPYYNKMFENELTNQLNQWMKKMPNETLEEYQLRVNEESRSAKAHELALKLATRMAEGAIEEPVMTMGDYNTKTGQLVLHLGKMNDVYINVPSDEIKNFASKDTNIKLQDVKYMLTENDLFEVAYVEVLNPATGKVYVYDKMKMDPLSFNQTDINLVPLDIIMKTTMDEESLMNIKEEVINLAKQEQIISDNTHIFVVAQVSNNISADGKPTFNYDINFTYEVENDFSARDDFKPGSFHTEDSGAAMSMLKIMKKAFETDFAKYVQAGKIVKFSITGTADAIPITNRIAYDGAYGNYQSEPVYKGNELTTLELTEDSGISDNYQLAFARAIGVQQYIEKKLEKFSNMKRDYDYHIDVSNKEGSQYRRISVQCSFINAF